MAYGIQNPETVLEQFFFALCSNNQMTKSQKNQADFYNLLHEFFRDF